VAPASSAIRPPELDEGEMTRTNLRLPEPLKAAIEHAAARERLSVNAWLVRAAGAALASDDPDRAQRPRGGRLGQGYTGWVR
jgi:HicB family